MRGFRLTAPQRDALRQLAKASPDTREARRALALLDLARGESVTDIADRYGVSRETVYQWAARLGADPRRYGYRHPAWTMPLLQHHLRRQGVEASITTIRRALRRLGYRWKRPRFVLSRRDPHWRQAKGGSSAG